MRILFITGILLAGSLTTASAQSSSRLLTSARGGGDYGDGFTIGLGFSAGKVLFNSYETSSYYGNYSEAMDNGGATAFSFIAGYRFSHRFGLFAGLESQRLKFSYHYSDLASDTSYSQDFKVKSFQIPVYARFSFGRAGKVGASLDMGLKLCFQSVEPGGGAGYNDLVSHFAPAIFLSPAVEIPVMPGLHISTGPALQVRAPISGDSYNSLGAIGDATWKLNALYDF